MSCFVFKIIVVLGVTIARNIVYTVLVSLKFLYDNFAEIIN